MQECFNKLGLENVVLLKSAGQKDVYRATSSKIGDVVIKIIKPNQNAERIEREIEIIERLKNINTSIIHNHGYIECEKGKFKYIIESFIDGVCLKDYLEQVKTLSYDEVVIFLTQMLEIIEILEENSIVHRDIKPDNIIKKDEKYFLIDFGIARELDKVSITPTANNYGPATVMYAPMEQIENEKHLINSRADLYSTCLIAYEMITGHNPYYEEGDNLPQIMRKIEKGKFKSLENTEYQDINEFIETCINRFAGRRPSSALIARKWFMDIK
ncbi:serine/threonine protein kinase [Aliarcobacter thereius]|uniref:Serine/threonine protein kinase n=1 Tax=Aliarcobacter thereius TaxID=544718 RepID=A0A5R9H257_9BACT|nr:serine/threonine-protein kinase [Aliarcobacter thereius]TLS71380.1 serine/threonine protein kinase [Aliarcobacter thereius]